MQEAWSSTPPTENPYSTLNDKFRATARKLQAWSSKWIGNVRLQIAIALEIILRLDVAMDTRPLSVAEIDLRRTLKRKLLGLSSLERTIARQKSRLLHLKDGDANSRFFHQHARHRQRKNALLSLAHNSEHITGQENIASIVDEFYNRLLGTATPREHRLNLDALNLPVRDLCELEGPFSEEEVLRTIKSMPLDKAPGPDGFTTRFYVSCWSIIKYDLLAAFSMFRRGDMRGLASINKALVILLPKKDGADELRDFRPVS